MYIETERLIIRDFVQDDANDLYEIMSDDETMENLEPAYTFEQTVKFLSEFCVEKKGAVAVVYKENGKVIGYILFNKISDRVYEMGWIFNKSYWRKGYAYESCKAVLDYGFDELNAHKVFAETIDAVKSICLMKKLGMKMEGIQRSQVKNIHGNWADMYLFGMLKEDREEDFVSYL